MPTRLAATALLLSFAIASPAFADGGTIRFEGEIVESSCNLVTVPGTEPAALNLQVADENDACSRRQPAFTAQYLPLNGNDTRVDNQVITITYN